MVKREIKIEGKRHLMNKSLNKNFHFWNRIKTLMIAGLIGLNLQGVTQTKYGIRLGALWPSGNQNAGSEFVDYGSSILSYSVALFTDLELGYQTTLNVGLGYEEREVKYEANIPTAPTDFFIRNTISGSDRFKYLVLPVFFAYAPIEHIRFSTGPQLGVLLDVKPEVPLPFFRPVNTQTFARNIDLSWGVGLAFQCNRSTLGARYQLGLLDLNKPWVEGTKYLINTLQVFLAVNFN